MRSIEILIASIVPIETHIEKLEEAIAEYKIIPSEDNFDSICAVATMILTRRITGGDLKGAIKMVQQYEKHKERDRLFEPEEN